MNEEMTQKLLKRFNEYVRNNPNIVFRKRTNTNIYEKVGLSIQDTFIPVSCQNNVNQCAVMGTCEIHFPMNENDTFSFGQTSFNALIQYRFFSSDCEEASIDFEIEEIVNNLIELR